MGLKGAKRGPKSRTGQNRVAQAKQVQIGRTGQNRAKQGRTGPTRDECGQTWSNEAKGGTSGTKQGLMRPNGAEEG